MDLRLLAGGATIGLSQVESGNGEDLRVGDAAALALGIGYRWGWFAGSHVQLGFTHALMRYEWVGHTEVQDVSDFGGSGYWLRTNSYTVVSPVGVYLELFPSSDSGFFANVSGSVGVVPSNDDPWDVLFMAGYGLEVGHELRGPTKAGLALFVRYDNWVGTESGFHTDFPAGLASHELTIGVRWAFGSPG